MRRTLLARCPDTVSDIIEFQAMFNGAQAEADRLEDWIEAAYDETYPDTASEYGIARWEKILGIVPGISDTLAERRFRVQAALSLTLPYTYRRLEQLLELACGPGNYSIELYPNEFRIRVNIGLVSAANYNTVVDLLEQVVPVNMIVETEIEFTRHSELTGYTHGELAAYTHQEIREKGDDVL